jgi:2-amino-4-hydroxy-6-hydroxymethyldihydropteridine diphosphokinase
MDPVPELRRRPVCVCIALGSNLGDRAAHLAGAVAALRREPEIDVVAVSAVYETAPVGPPPQGPYLNAALRATTRLAPGALLERLRHIEASRGRCRRRERWAARTLDLDLLFYGDERIDEVGLCVPHPRLHERAFVLEPLCDVAAAFVHPVLAETVADLARRVRDPSAVRRQTRLDLNSHE